jgi:hypothetical protein
MNLGLNIEYEDVDWIDLAQEREQWYVVGNLQVL